MPTDWENRYLEGDTPWDKGEASPGLIDFLDREPLKGRVLIPGCGLGHDVRAIAAAGGAAVEPVGLDIAPAAVERARSFPRAGRERYELGDLFALPPEWRGAFDAVWEHTCFCAIDPSLREAYAASVEGALKPGGLFLAIFYLNPDMEPGENGPPFGATPAELDGFFGSRFELVDDWTPARAFKGREGRERMRLYRKGP